jgi:hypothetical protein
VKCNCYNDVTVTGKTADNTMVAERRERELATAETGVAEACNAFEKYRKDRCGG